MTPAGLKTQKHQQNIEALWLMVLLTVSCKLKENRLFQKCKIYPTKCMFNCYANHTITEIEYNEKEYALQINISKQLNTSRIKQYFKNITHIKLSKNLNT